MPMAYVYERFGGPEVEHFADLLNRSRVRASC